MSRDWIKQDFRFSGNTNNIFQYLWALSQTDLISLGSFMYDPPNTLPEFFLNSSNYITSLMLFPFDVKDLTLQNRPQYLEIGGVSSKTSKYPITGTYVPNINTYFLGEYKVTPKFNNFADYNGYSQIEVWLPFYGTEEVSITDVLNKYLQVYITVDYNSGQASYAICSSETQFSGIWYLANSENARILKTCICQLGVELPLGKTNATDMRRNVIMSAASAVVGVATNSYIANAGMATSKVQSTTTTKRTRRNPKTGRQITMSTKSVEKEQVIDSSNHYKISAMKECFEYGATALANMHIAGHTDRSNNPATMGNFCRAVKIIRYYPKLQPTDDNYNKLYGKPYGQTSKLSSVNGFTIVSAIHFEGNGFGTATEEELAMIEEQFSDGVIL